MQEYVNYLESIISFLKEFDLENKKNNQEKDLEIMRLKRGNESLQEVIKIKDDVIDSLKPSKKKE